MKVTLQFLKKQGTCLDGVERFKKVFNKSAELREVILYGIKSKDRTTLEYCNWLIVRKMTHEQKVQYAIYAAEQVLQIFEEKYPDDDRPRKAIQAVKNYLKYKTKDAAARAVAAAARAAAAAADADAAADAAARAAYAAARAFDKEWIKMKNRILRYGLKLIYKKEKTL